MVLNILNYIIRIEKISNEIILKKELEYRKVEEDLEKIKRKNLDYLNIR